MKIEAPYWAWVALINRLIAWVEYKGVKQEGRLTATAATACCFSASGLPCLGLLLCYRALSYAILPWSQLTTNWNLYKLWAKINPSSLKFGVKYCVSTTRKVTKTHNKHNYIIHVLAILEYHRKMIHRTQEIIFSLQSSYKVFWIQQLFMEDTQCATHCGANTGLLTVVFGHLKPSCFEMLFLNKMNQVNRFISSCISLFLCCYFSNIIRTC